MRPTDDAHLPVVKTTLMVRTIVCGALLLLPALVQADDAAIPEIAAKLDELYSRRDDVKVQEETEKLLADSLKANPQAYPLVWRAARFHIWQAETAPNDSRKKQEAKIAWNFGDQAMKLSPAAPEGNYYAAAGVGIWGEANGVMKSISEGVDGKFNERLDKAIAIDPLVGRGGPYLARARYYYVVPWPMRDLPKSNEFLQKVLEKHPESLRAKLYLADNLLKDGEAKKAKELVDAVLAGDEAYDPPEARRVKSMAKKTKAAVDDAL
jgi:hypothetical protein